MIADVSIYHSTNESFINWFALIADNREASEIWNKVLSGEELDAVEKTRAHSLLSILFLSYEANYQQEQLGVIGRSTLEMPVVQDLIALPTIAHWWTTNGPKFFTTEFRKQVDQIKANI